MSSGLGERQGSLPLPSVEPLPSLMPPPPSPALLEGNEKPDIPLGMDIWDIPLGIDIWDMPEGKAKLLCAFMLRVWSLRLSPIMLGSLVSLGLQSTASPEK